MIEGQDAPGAPMEPYLHFLQLFVDCVLLVEKFLFLFMKCLLLLLQSIEQVEDFAEGNFLHIPHYRQKGLDKSMRKCNTVAVMVGICNHTFAAQNAGPEGHRLTYHDINADLRDRRFAFKEIL